MPRITPELLAKKHSEVTWETVPVHMSLLLANSADELLARRTGDDSRVKQEDRESMLKRFWDLDGPSEMHYYMLTLSMCVCAP